MGATYSRGRQTNRRGACHEAHKDGVGTASGDDNRRSGRGSAIVRRRCFWCENHRSNDVYEVATGVNSGEAGVPDELHLSMKQSSSTFNQGTSSSEDKLQQQQPDVDTSDIFPYMHLRQETLMQIISCFPFPSPSSSTDSSPTTTRQRQFHSRLTRLTHDYNDSNNDDNSRCVRSLRLANRTAASSVAASLRFGRSRSVNDSERCTCDKTSPAECNVQFRRRACTHEPAQKKNSAVETLAMVSADTMAITALPLDCWLKERLKRWVQLSGHEGTIVPASDQTLWKRRSCANYNEASAYRALMKDRALVGFVPRYYREVEHKNETFIEIDDLTAQFDNPAIMDIKMGTRTFLESEVMNNNKRKDLYEKMVSLSVNELTEQEHAEKAITKMRYMLYREKSSSTFLLGCRIEAAKMSGGKLEKNFKKVHTRDEVGKTLWNFFGDRAIRVASQILSRLKQMRQAIEQSEFFRNHEVIGSSLLLMYDSQNASVWMIDFAKSIPVDRDSIDHRSKWIYGNHEDGYLFGLDSLIMIVEEELNRHSPF